VAVDDLAAAVPEYPDVQETVRLALMGFRGELDRLLVETQSLASDSPVLSFPMVAWQLLERFGDSTFATALGRRPQAQQQVVVLMLDRASYPAFRQRFPRTYALGAHHPARANLDSLAGPPLQATVTLAEGPVYFQGGLTTQAEVVPGTCSMPVFPYSLWHANVTGRVAMQFDIDTTGHVPAESVVPVAASNPGFIAPTVAAVRSCRFRPGELAGHRVRVRMWQPVNYDIAF